ncbi:hypothetical protein Leryth_003635 [Lithospermum erythrorhizon]|nr:hypothetical protein Leryth_003635 [Lithospermum erythrorhizon]
MVLHKRRIRKSFSIKERRGHFRKLYCSFIQELGIELKVPQVTIATAMILCHRFYTRQSLAKNDWQKLPSADINATKETEWSSSSISNQGSAISTVEDGVARPTASECNRQPSCEIVRSDSKCNTIDVNHIKELMRKRKIDRRKESTKDMEDEINSESWIERELENGIEPSSSPSKKRKIL